MKKLTVAQAIAEGYIYFGYYDNDFQNVQTIGLDIPDFNRKVVLYNNKPNHPTIPDDYLSDMISDQIYCHVGDVTGDDDPQWAYDAVKGLDWSFMTKAINQVLQLKGYYIETDIELIPD